MKKKNTKTRFHMKISHRVIGPSAYRVDCSRAFCFGRFSIRDQTNGGLALFSVAAGLEMTTYYIYVPTCWLSVLTCY